jgi:hypothetical protein
VIRERPPQPHTDDHCASPRSRPARCVDRPSWHGHDRPVGSPSRKNNLAACAITRALALGGCARSASPASTSDGFAAAKSRHENRRAGSSTSARHPRWCRVRIMMRRGVVPDAIYRVSARNGQHAVRRSVCGRYSGACTYGRAHLREKAAVSRTWRTQQWRGAELGAFGRGPHSPAQNTPRAH